MFCTENLWINAIHVFGFKVIWILHWFWQLSIIATRISKKRHAFFFQLWILDIKIVWSNFWNGCQEKWWTMCIEDFLGGKLPPLQRKIGVPFGCLCGFGTLTSRKSLQQSFAMAAPQQMLLQRDRSNRNPADATVLACFRRPRNHHADHQSKLPLDLFRGRQAAPPCRQVFCRDRLQMALAKKNAFKKPGQKLGKSWQRLARQIELLSEREKTQNTHVWRMYKKHCALRGILNPTTELCDGNCLFQSGLPNWVEHLWPNHPTASVHVSQPILYLSQALGCSWCARVSYKPFCAYVVSLFLRRLGPTKWDHRL